MPPSPSEIMERVTDTEGDVKEIKLALIYGKEEFARIAGTIGDIRGDFKDIRKDLKDVVEAVEKKFEGIHDKARLLFIGATGSIIIFLANQVMDIIKTAKGG